MKIAVQLPLCVCLYLDFVYFFGNKLSFHLEQSVLCKVSHCRPIVRPSALPASDISQIYAGLHTCLTR